MKKIIVLIILLIGLSVQAVVIKGGVHYTVESAREEAFSKVRYTIPMDEHKKYLTDPGFSLDKNGKPKIRKFLRDVTFYADVEYSVFSITTGYTYFYDSNGKLVALSKLLKNRNNALNQKYDSSGNLIKVFFDVTPSHSYVYNPDKTYEGQWNGKYFYDSNGNIVNKRSHKLIYK